MLISRHQFSRPSTSTGPLQNTLDQTVYIAALLFTDDRRYIGIPNLPVGEISTAFNSIHALGRHDLISRGGRLAYTGEERKLNMGHNFCLPICFMLPEILFTMK